MTAARPIPHPRPIRRALLTSARTTLVAGLAAWGIVTLQSPTHDWTQAGQAVWSMRLYLGLIFAVVLVWDFVALRRHAARHD